MPVRWSH
ncbi:hypothetical protein YPPY92_2134, partial [Yersinia pestis PY-92]